MNHLENPTDSSLYAWDQLQNIPHLCKEYGLYAKIVDYKNAFCILGRGIYIVISQDPILDDVNPYQLVLRNERNTKAIYPKDFAIQLTEDNYMVALHEIKQFCQTSILLRTLFKEFEADLPDCIRHSEFVGLKNWNEGRYDEEMGSAYQIKCHEGLADFFKKEKKKNHLFQENRRFFRSDKFDEGAGRLQQISDFNNRMEPVVRLNVLMQYTDHVNRIEIPEELYEPFLNYLKKCYPDVTIAVNEKKVVDSGLIELSHKLPKDHPIMKQKPITSAAFHDIIEKDFATEGFACVEDYKPARWESRDIFYKAIDEPQIIAVFNDLCFAFAQSDPYHTLTERGDCLKVDLCVENIHEFVAKAKANHLMFHIDNTGKSAMPSLETLHVIYNKKDQSIMDNILNSMIEKNANTTHLLYEQQLLHAPTLEKQLLDGKDIISKQSALSGNKSGGRYDIKGQDR